MAECWYLLNIFPVLLYGSHIPHHHPLRWGSCHPPERHENGGFREALSLTQGHMAVSWDLSAGLTPKFMLGSLHAFAQCLLWACLAPGTVLGAGDSH